MCRRLFEASEEPLVIPAPVLVEVDYWIHARLHQGVLAALVDDIIAGAYRVEDLCPTDYLGVYDVISSYEDADVGFVDAAVLAIVERLNEPKLATLDQRHFRMLRPRHVPALTLLPEDLEPS